MSANQVPLNRKAREDSGKAELRTWPALVNMWEAGRQADNLRRVLRIVEGK